MIDYLSLLHRLIIFSLPLTFYHVTMVHEIAKNFVVLNFLSGIGPVWYVCLKTENCCLKIFMEIRVGKKVRWNV